MLRGGFVIVVLKALYLFKRNILKIKEKSVKNKTYEII